MKQLTENHNGESGAVDTSSASPLRNPQLPSLEVGWELPVADGRKEKLHRRAGLVICFGRDHVSAIKADTRIDPLPVEVLGRVPYAPDTVGEDLASRALESFSCLMDSLPPQGRTLSVLLGTPPVARRLLHLPKANRGQLRSLVKVVAQGEGADVVGHEVRSASFESGQEGLAVDALWVEGAFLNGIEQCATRHGFQVRHIAGRPASSVVLAQLFGVQSALPERFLAVEYGEQLIRIALVNKGAVAFLRAVDLDAESQHDIPSRIATEVQRTNIFMKTRLRQSPSDRFLVLGDDASAIDAIAQRVRAQFGVQVHQVLTRFDAASALEGKIRSWAYDAVALLAAKDLSRIGAVRLRSPKRRERNRAFTWIPLGVVLGAMFLAASWWAYREASLQERNAAKALVTASDAASAVPDMSSARERVEAIREQFRHMSKEIIASTRLAAPSREVLIDITERLPRSILVTRTLLETKAEIASDPAAETNMISRRFLTIEGRVIDAAVKAPATMALAGKAVRQSPFVASVRDASGQYDPFLGATENPMSRQYPVLMHIELKEKP